nr:hypothetical protein [Candidatus Omnitrophota bacterium]
GAGTGEYAKAVKKADNELIAATDAGRDGEAERAVLDAAIGDLQNLNGSVSREQKFLTAFQIITTGAIHGLHLYYLKTTTSRLDDQVAGRAARQRDPGHPTECVIMEAGDLENAEARDFRGHITSIIDPGIFDVDRVLSSQEERGSLFGRTIAYDRMRQELYQQARELRAEWVSIQRSLLLLDLADLLKGRSELVARAATPKLGKAKKDALEADIARLDSEVALLEEKLMTGLADLRNAANELEAAMKSPEAAGMVRADYDKAKKDIEDKLAKLRSELGDIRSSGLSRDTLRDRLASVEEDMMVFFDLAQRNLDEMSADMRTIRAPFVVADEKQRLWRAPREEKLWKGLIGEPVSSRMIKGIDAGNMSKGEFLDAAATAAKKRGLDKELQELIDIMMPVLNGIPYADGEATKKAIVEQLEADKKESSDLYRLIAGEKIFYYRFKAFAEMAIDNIFDSVLGEGKPGVTNRVRKWWSERGKEKKPEEERDGRIASAKELREYLIAALGISEEDIDAAMAEMGFGPSESLEELARTKSEKEFQAIINNLKSTLKKNLAGTITFNGRVLEECRGSIMADLLDREATARHEVMSTVDKTEASKTRAIEKYEKRLSKMSKDFLKSDSYIRALAGAFVGKQLMLQSDRELPGEESVLPDETPYENIVKDAAAEAAGALAAKTKGKWMRFVAWVRGKDNWIGRAVSWFAGERPGDYARARVPMDGDALTGPVRTYRMASEEIRQTMLEEETAPDLQWQMAVERAGREARPTEVSTDKPQISQVGTPRKESNESAALEARAKDSG